MNNIEKEPENARPLISKLSVASIFFLAWTTVLLLIIVPRMLYSSWTDRNAQLPEKIVVTALCLAVPWGVVTTWVWSRNYRKLKLSSSTRLLFGPRPSNPDELRAWIWGRQCRYAFLTVVICLVAFAILIWFRER